MNKQTNNQTEIVSLHFQELAAAVQTHISEPEQESFFTRVSLSSILAPAWSDCDCFEAKRPLHLEEQGHPQLRTLPEMCLLSIGSNDLGELLDEFSLFCGDSHCQTPQAAQPPAQLPKQHQFSDVFLVFKILALLNLLISFRIAKML